MHGNITSKEFRHTLQQRRSDAHYFREDWTHNISEEVGYMPYLATEYDEITSEYHINQSRLENIKSHC